MAYLSQVVSVVVAGGAGTAKFGLRGEATRISWQPPAGAVFSWATSDPEGFQIDGGDSSPLSTRVFPTTAQYDASDNVMAVSGASVDGTYKAKVYAKHGNRDV